MDFDVNIEASGSGPLGLQYTITPEGSSESVILLYDPNRGFSVLTNQDGQYLEVEGTRYNQDVDDSVPEHEIFGDGVFYDPENSLTIRVTEEPNGDPRVSVSLPDGRNLDIFPHQDFGNVYDEEPSSGNGPQQGYVIKPQPFMGV